MSDTSPKNQNALTAGHTPARPTAVPKPRELLYEFVLDCVQIRCELIDHGRWGVDAQILKNDELFDCRMFPSRPLAVSWAETRRSTIESFGTDAPI